MPPSTPTLGISPISPPVDMLPSTPPAFEALPTEILANILRQMASPEDVYSTIRASPTALGSFLSFREAILIEMIQTHLPPEILTEYLGLLHAPKFEDFNHVPEEELQAMYSEQTSEKSAIWELCKFHDWPIVLHDFFETHFENVRATKSSGIQRYSIPQAYEKDKIKYIVSIYGTLKRFIRDYQRFVRLMLAREPLGGKPPPLCDLGFSTRQQEPDFLSLYSWLPLQENEMIRLQRGFLRYELCSRLSAIPTVKAQVVKWLWSFLDYDDTWLSKYIERWEVEEIRCVWTFVLRQYQTLLQEIVADFRSDVRRLSRKARHTPVTKIVLAPDMLHPFNPIGFEIWAYSMSCLGLPMLQQVLRSEFDDQRRFFKITISGSDFDLSDAGALFLVDEIQRVVAWRQEDISDKGPSPIYKTIATELARWHESERNQSDCDPKRLDAVDTAIKNIGWVFWEDTIRFQSSIWPFPLRREDARDVRKFLETLSKSSPPGMFEIDERCPEQCMYVTEEDRNGELSDKYPIDPPEPPGYQEYFKFFAGRLRDISDLPSKEVSSTFRELCSGITTGEESLAPEAS